MSLPRTPLLTADCVVFDNERRLLAIRRKNPPFKGELALPGGFVDIGETVEAAARRELREETGLIAHRLRLIGVYSDPSRDSRAHTCSIAYLAHVDDAQPEAGDDAEAVEWITDPSTEKFAFDHAKIVKDALELLG
jgi:8-oxo-dGTP diphosphatase